MESMLDEVDATLALLGQADTSGDDSLDVDVDAALAMLARSGLYPAPHFEGSLLEHLDDAIAGLSRGPEVALD